jgi:hypothetical protein
MTLLSTTHWQILAAVVCLTLSGSLAVWLLSRKRPTADELELARRLFLKQSGRLVDGMLLDVCEMQAPNGQTLTMLVYSYRVGGVDYECSQDITTMLDELDVAQVRAGFPCSVRHQPGSPQNSIVVAEGWTGLRTSLPVISALEAQSPANLIRRRHSRS